MKNILLNKFVLLSLMFFLMAAPFRFIGAQTGESSVVIQPARVEINAAPGEKVLRQFSIINRSNYNLRLRVTVKDFKQVEENGKVEFFEAEEGSATLWLIPQFVEVALKPLESRDVGLVVSVPEDFSAGGHYGAVMFESVDNSGSINSANFGELVLLTVSNPLVQNSASANVVDFDAKRFQQGGSADFSLSLENSGNTHLNASGQLILRDWLNKEVGSYNVGQLLVYPGTRRTFQWRWNETPFAGIYRADVMLSEGLQGQDLQKISSRWFVIFPWQLLLGVLGVVGIAIYLFLRKMNLFSFKRFSGKKLKIKVPSREKKYSGASLIEEIFEKD